MNIFKKIKIKMFDNKLDECLKEANKLYKEKGDIVVCNYCGQLMPKKEAGVVFDIVTRKNTYFHEKCFQENEPIQQGMPKPKE